MIRIPGAACPERRLSRFLRRGPGPCSPLATLIIDLVDPRTRQLVWRGWGVGDFEAAVQPGRAQGYLSAAVKGILQHYPPY